MDLFKFALTNLPTLVLLDYIKKAGDIIFVIDANLEG